MGFFHKIFHMEDDFVNFLIRAEDVISFVKNMRHIVGLKITYYEEKGNGEDSLQIS